MKIFALAVISILILFSSCNKEKRLPILGEKAFENREVNGETVTDTLYFTLPDFKFVNQDSQYVTSQTFDNKIYVADFFFTSCPTICPTMKTQMLRVYDKYENEPSLSFLSHSIDPKHDTVALLKDYSERMDVKTEKWHFVTGRQEDIFEVAQKGYLVPAQEDEGAPGGLLHSGAFILVDKQKRIRGFYDGTDPKKVDKLIDDIEVLLNEYSD